MHVTVEIPDDIAQRVAAAGVDLSQSAREAFALEEYKAGRLTRPKLRRFLGFQTRYQLDGFLKQRGIHSDYAIEDFHCEFADLKELGL